ncbi:hypothetical protein VIGAN_01149100 [Vigna angularis var. angularis]|uniref:Uncharacterized protein n=1 Tax=Vigna angularis var. angularis TaxID=157739 RepID=A0A0S3QZY3_PHAAN|nr:hypothetical protein VIGAN_01149100 [Vigna angularis var. angularis]
MGSFCERWIIVGFVIVVSFSCMMERAVAARHLMHIPNLPNPSTLSPSPSFSPLQPLPFLVVTCNVLGFCPSPPPPSTTTAP